jgi:hypothetical protein
VSSAGVSSIDRSSVVPGRAFMLASFSLAQERPPHKIVKLGNRVLRFTIKRDGWRTL